MIIKRHTTHKVSNEKLLQINATACGGCQDVAQIKSLHFVNKYTISSVK